MNGYTAVKESDRKEESHYGPDKIKRQDDKEFSLVQCKGAVLRCENERPLKRIVSDKEREQLHAREGAG